MSEAAIALAKLLRVEFLMIAYRSEKCTTEKLLEMNNKCGKCISAPPLLMHE